MSATTSNTIAITAAAGPMPAYKGKALRSWAELPEEVVRLIATYYLLDITTGTYIPSTWEARRLWQSRMVYTAIRDSLNIEKHLMGICQSWRRAIEQHFFWNHIVNIIDPNDFLIFHMTVHPKPQHENASTIAAPIRRTYHQHLKNIIASSCVVCRINYPTTTLGLANAKRPMITTYLGTLGICKDHDRRRASYCGLCLRDTVVTTGPDATARDYELSQAIAIVENEDEESWPAVDSTCKKCRVEWLWRRANNGTRDREAIGGPTMQSEDWETRQTVENFIEMGEGTIGEVLALAREKQWLRLHTKYEALGQHMLAAQVTHQRSEAAHVRREEEEEEDSEEDREAMMTRGSGQVRDLSLTSWARERILDGHWISPADIYYSNTAPGQPLVVPTIHPLPWAREVEHQSESNEEEKHPTRTTIAAEAPPTYALCEQAYVAHMKSMREILGPPMRNLVRKLVMECSLPSERGYEDPAHRARKMSLDEVLKVLREEEGVWYDGVDWVEKRRNEEETSRRRRLEAEAEARSAAKEDDRDSTTSSSSSGDSGKSSHHGSNATSPVLSTTTLQTTPSPPPIVDEGPRVSKKQEGPSSPLESNVRQESHVLPPRPRFIPVDPVRSTPRLLSAIPYVPVTPGHLPSYSFEALRTAWREACAPLYHCACTVCERAKVAEMNARAAYAVLNSVVPSQSQAINPTSRGVIYPPSVVRTIDASEIELKEINEADLDGDGEEEVDYDSELEYDEEEDDEDADEEIDDEDDPNDPRYEVDEADYRYSPSPEPEPRVRKRSSDELEDDLEEVLIDTPSFRKPDGGTPPKRARIGDDAVILHSADEGDHSGHEDPEETITAPVLLSSPRRLKKRNSEELDDGDVVVESLSNKRVKVGRGSSPVVESPVSIGYPSLGGEELRVAVVPEAVEDKPRIASHRRVTKADMDTLITLEDTGQ